jgi:hypothetical protein
MHELREYERLFVKFQGFVEGHGFGRAVTETSLTGFSR